MVEGGVKDHAMSMAPWVARSRDAYVSSVSNRGAVPTHYFGQVPEHLNRKRKGHATASLVNQSFALLHFSISL